MIEMARGSDGRFTLSCGGDTFNTAIYLARAGVDVAYATALGDDPYSESIVAMATAEAVKTDLMLRVPGRQPGLYTIETDAKGERRFRYWRNEAPARELFELPDWNRIAESLLAARLIYFSGVTLSMATFAPMGGRAIWRAPARFTWKRSSASTWRCRPTTTRRCCGAIRVPRRLSSGCRPSALVKSS
jgi:2-dehydro-3-deoxygluconokinase